MEFAPIYHFVKKYSSMKNVSKVIALFLFVNLIPIFAQNPTDENANLIKELKANAHPLILEKGKLSGAGADFLWREAEKSQFFLIGEEHGMAENPLFAAAVLQEINRFGYKYFAAEIGRLTAKQLEKSGRSKPVNEVLADFNRRYPFSLPFFSWQEEGTLLETALKIPLGKVPTLWGLDQEFFFSPVYHFERLRELAPNAKSRAIVDEYYEKVKIEFTKIVETKNPSTAFIASAKPSDFERLGTAFGAKDTEARQILSDLRESAEIYQKNFRGEIYGNNHQRAQLIKRRFMDYYNSALTTEKMPKVFFKFGSAHVIRGRNYVSTFDVGTLASEIADTNGSKSFHILMIAADGLQNKFLPFIGNEADKKRKLDAVKVYSYFDAHPFVRLVENSGWQVIDLRPLRPLLGTSKLNNLPKGFADLLFGFDAVLLVDKANPTTLY